MGQWTLEQKGTRWQVVNGRGRPIPGEVFRTRNEANARMRDLRGASLVMSTDVPTQDTVSIPEIEVKRARMAHARAVRMQRLAEAKASGA